MFSVLSFQNMFFSFSFSAFESSVFCVLSFQLLPRKEIKEAALKETLGLVKEISQHFRRFCRYLGSALLCCCCGLELHGNMLCKCFFLPSRGKNKLQFTDLYVVQ